MNEMNERRSSAEIVAEWRAELEIHDREAQDGDRTWHFTHYIRADPEMFIRAALRELDRLTAERDAARAAVNTLVREFEGVPEEFERMHARANRDGLYPNGTVYSMYAEKTVAALRAALGTESEASE